MPSILGSSIKRQYPNIIINLISSSLSSWIVKWETLGCINVIISSDLMLGRFCRSVVARTAKHHKQWTTLQSHKSYGSELLSSLIHQFCLWAWAFFNAPFNLSPKLQLLASFSNCKWGWLWQIVLKYILKVNPNTHPYILSDCWKMGAVVKIWFKSLIDTFTWG